VWAARKRASDRTAICILNSFDEAILNALNKLSRESYTFDASVALLADLETAKGAVFMAFLWWGWFRVGKDNNDARATVLMGIVSAAAAVLLARGLAFVLPFRERPIHDDSYDFIRPYELDAGFLSNWSGFPSDHAALFCALAASLFFISRPLGIISGIYAFVFILMPRMYLGLHWPTDIIAGAILGVGVAWICTLPRLRDAVSKPVFQFVDQQPGLFYAGLFFLTFQIATLFDEARETASFLADTAERFLT
jgi:undecaprenyl-diphosphatase